MKKKMDWGARAMACGVLLATAGTAHAGLSQVVLEVHAEVNGQRGVYKVEQSAGTWSGTHFNWALSEPVEIKTSSGVVLGVLNSAAVAVIEDPVVSVNFNITSTAQQTTFTIVSPVLSFPTLATAVGAASAGVSVTDLGGNGAVLTPLSGGAYAADYNGVAPGGQNFATLLSNNVVAGAFSTETASEDFPGGGGFVPIAGAVDDISARWQFTLSADDLASGTGVFTVVPAPSALGLLAVAGIGCGRRRR